MSTVGDLDDIGRLLAFAAQPKLRPAAEDTYAALVERYHQDPDFAAAAESVLAGAGLDLLVDTREGFIVTATSDSPLRATVTDIMKRANPVHRSLIGAVVLGVARTAFPDPAMLDDPDRVGVFTTRDVVETLDRVAETHRDATGDDAVADEDEVETWRRWVDLNDTRVDARRRSASDRPGIVRKVCGFLVEVGHLESRSTLEDGTWATRARFRHAVAALTTDSDLYSDINELLTVDGEHSGD